MFAGQPLSILGSTGPVLVFESITFQFCDTYGKTEIYILDMYRRCFLVYFTSLRHEVTKFPYLIIMLVPGARFGLHVIPFLDRDVDRRDFITHGRIRFVLSRLLHHSFHRRIIRHIDRPYFYTKSLFQGVYPEF